MLANSYENRKKIHQNFYCALFSHKSRQLPVHINDMTIFVLPHFHPSYKLNWKNLQLSRLRNGKYLNLILCLTKILSEFFYRTGP